MKMVEEYLAYAAIAQAKHIPDMAERHVYLGSASRLAASEPEEADSLIDLAF